MADTPMVWVGRWFQEVWNQAGETCANRTQQKLARIEPSFWIGRHGLPLNQAIRGCAGKSGDHDMLECAWHGFSEFGDS